MFDRTCSFIYQVFPHSRHKMWNKNLSIFFSGTFQRRVDGVVQHPGDLLAARDLRRGLRGEVFGSGERSGPKTADSRRREGSTRQDDWTRRRRLRSNVHHSDAKTFRNPQQVGSRSRSFFIFHFSFFILQN